MAVDFYLNLDKDRVECVISAAEKYSIPEPILLAIADLENGKPGIKVKNTNGTYDLGYMQFNTSFLSSLTKYGITHDDVLGKDCYSFDLAAWRIAGHIKNDKSNDLWSRVANYHSKTAKFNLLYKEKLLRKVTEWDKWFLEYKGKKNNISETDITVSMIPPMPRIKKVDKESDKESELYFLKKEKVVANKSNYNLTDQDKVIYEAINNSSRVNFVVK